MQFTPHLIFDGDCAEAFAVYAELFGGSITYQGTYGEMPVSDDMPAIPESAKDRIMHAQLQVGEQSLLGADAMPGADPTCGGGYQPPRGQWVTVHVDDVAEGRRLFDALETNGETVMPFEATFWSTGFGMLRDRFGTPWMINVAQEPGQAPQQGGES